MPRRLLIVEPGQTRYAGRTLAIGVGHWSEGIERMSSWWQGSVELIGNSPDPRIEGVDRFHSLREFLASPRRSPYTLVRSRLARSVNSLAGGMLSAYLLRREWEGTASDTLSDTLRDEIERNPETTLFVPTAIPIVVETIVRSAGELRRLGGEQLTVIVRFASQGHDRVYLDPRTFASQIRRWRDRAGDLDLRMGVELEASSQRYSRATGAPVAWIPWPVDSSAQSASSKRTNQRRPRIFVYAHREEQGARDAARIARAIIEQFDGEVDVEVKIGTRAAAVVGQTEWERVAQTKSLELETDLLSPSQLRVRMARCDAVVMPYMVRPYIRRGSALMWGALDQWVPMVAPARTGFGDEISRHGVGFSYLDQDEIPALVVRCIRERERLHEAIGAYQAHRTNALVALFGQERGA